MIAPDTQIEFRRHGEIVHGKTVELPKGWEAFKENYARIQLHDENTCRLVRFHEVRVPYGE